MRSPIMEIAAADGAHLDRIPGPQLAGLPALLRHGTPQQKERFLRPLARGELLGAFCLTEPGAGSDAAAIATRPSASATSSC
jgi:alkylation response protein AidB-like acyl-CoA dehydrogenase